MAGFSDEELKTPRSNYIFSRKKELILDLVTPLAGKESWILAAAPAIIYRFSAINGVL